MSYAGHQRLQFEIAPLARAFAISDGDADQLLLAMRAASSLWGGKWIPLLPVNADAEVVNGHEALLDVLQVESLIDFTGRLAQKDHYVTPSGRRLPMLSAKSLEDVSFWQPPPIVSFSASELVGHRLVQAAGTADLMAVAAAGRFADSAERDEWQQHRATVQESEDPAGLLSAQLERITLLDATTHGVSFLRRSASIAASMTLLYILPDDRTPFDDILWFWNARAIRPSQEGADLLLRRSQLDGDRVSQLGQHLRANSRSNPSLALASLSLTVHELQEVRVFLDVPEHTSTRWSEQIFSGKRVSPTAVVNVDFRPGWAGERVLGSVDQIVRPIFRPSTPLQVVNPLQFAPPFTGSYPVEVRLRGTMLAGPRRAAVASLYHPGAYWKGDALALRTALQPTYTLDLGVPSPDEILRSVVERRFVDSDKARQLRAVLTRETDLSLYRKRAVLAVIERLMPTDSRELRRQLSTGSTLPIGKPSEQLLWACGRGALTRLTYQRPSAQTP